MQTTSRSLLACSLLVLLACLAACNTTKGVGKDIENAGEGLKNSADKNGAE